MPTNSHDYDTPAKFTPNWHIPLNTNFSDIDLDVPLVDIEANRPSVPPTDFTFISTDNRSISVYGGETAGWKTIAGRGTPANPLSVGPYARGLMVNTHLPAGESLTLPTDYASLIAGSYRVDGELHVDGTLKIV